MRLQTFLVLVIGCSILPAGIWADVTVTFNPSDAMSKNVGKAIAEGKDPFTYLDPFAGRQAGETVSTRYNLNEAMVEKLEGTIMVQHANDAKPSALQTLSTIQKGDVLYVYDKSWVILKDHKGDRIGFNGGTVVIVDEFYIEGPDRQIRLLLQKGSLLFRTSGCNSRQSFFEINSGSVVTAINDTQAILSYDPAETHLKVQYLRGKLSVIDKNNEHKFGVQPVIGSHVVDVRDKKTVADSENETLEYIPEGSEYNWKDGVLADKAPSPIDELDANNFNRFFNGEPPLPPSNKNMLLNGSN